MSSSRSISSMSMSMSSMSEQCSGRAKCPHRHSRNLVTEDILVRGVH